MSTDDFKVLMSDLLTAADAFQNQAHVLSRLMPAGGPVVPDGGDTGVNQSMQQATQLLASMNAQLASSISQYVTRLRDAHAKFATTENDIASMASAATSARLDEQVRQYLLGSASGSAST